MATFRQSPGPIRYLPYPLPKKRERVRSGIERAPKRIWLRHRKFVRSHRCCVPGCTAFLVDVAHLRSVAEGAGTSLKPHDRFCVSLCRLHHLEEEACGPDTFGDRHCIDLWAIAAELVRRSPDMQMRLSLMLEEEGGRMSDLLLANPHFWTDRAAELRAIAENVRPGPQREQLLRLADLDDALAARARQGDRPLDSLATIPILQPRVGEGRDG